LRVHHSWSKRSASWGASGIRSRGRSLTNNKPASEHEPHKLFSAFKSTLFKVCPTRPAPHILPGVQCGFYLPDPSEIRINHMIK
jgi:hypothetical protein